MGPKRAPVHSSATAPVGGRPASFLAQRVPMLVEVHTGRRLIPGRLVSVLFGRRLDVQMLDLTTSYPAIGLDVTVVGNLPEGGRIRFASHVVDHRADEHLLMLAAPEIVVTEGARGYDRLLTMLVVEVQAKGQPPEPGRVLDISSSGLRIASSAKLSLGQTVRTRCDVPGYDHVVELDVLARVIRLAGVEPPIRSDLPAKPIYGLRFIDLSDEQRHELEEALTWQLTSPYHH